MVMAPASDSPATTEVFASGAVAAPTPPVDTFAAAVSGAAPADAPATTPTPAAPLTLPDDHPIMQELAALKADRERLAQIEAKTTEWQRQIETAQQAEARKAFEQQTQQQIGALKQWAAAYRDATGEEVPDTVLGGMQQAIQYGLALQNPEVQQRFNAVYEAAKVNYVQNQAWQLAAQHFGPTATIGTIQDAVRALTSIAPEAMAQVAPMLAERWRNGNLQRRQATGADRIEGGGNQGNVGASAESIWAAYGRGEIPWSDRVRAAGRALNVL